MVTELIVVAAMEAPVGRTAVQAEVKKPLVHAAEADAKAVTKEEKGAGRRRSHQRSC